MNLTDEQWEVLSPLFDKKQTGRGRPRRNAREVMDGILWILRTGAQWSELPDKYPAYQTCHRRFQQWNREGKMESALRYLARDLYNRANVDIKECFIDGMFVPAKKGALELAKLSGVKARRSWALQTMIVFLSPYAQTVLTRMKSSS